MYKTNLQNKMKITGTALFTGESISTKVQFKDGLYEYEVTLPGNFTNPIVHSTLEKGFLNTLTEYELIESMIDEEAKAQRLRDIEEYEGMLEQMELENESDNPKRVA